MSTDRLLIAALSLSLLLIVRQLPLLPATPLCSLSPSARHSVQHLDGASARSHRLALPCALAAVRGVAWARTRVTISCCLCVTISCCLVL